VTLHGAADAKARYRAQRQLSGSVNP